MKKQLRTFISYFTEEKHFGAKVKSILERYGVRSFLAHEDLEVSEKWRKRILEELCICDVFIPLLRSSLS